MVDRKHMANFKEDLAIELWVLYSLGLVLIAFRMAARRIHLRSFKKFQVDDYVMIFVVFTFTGVFVSTFQVANNGSNYVYFNLESVNLLTPKERSNAVWGSKMTLVLEEFTITTLWLIKACILILYSRLTIGLRENIIVKILAVYCLLGFIIIQVLLLAVWCKPIHQYWAVPVENSQCATYYRHMIVTSVFNMSSDLLMLLIPLPLLISSKLPLKRKLVVCAVFSLGIFVILAAVLNRYYNFTQKYSLIFLNWYVGEVSTAVFVSNIPLSWPLIRRLFALDDFGVSKRSRINTTSASNRQSSSRRTRTLRKSEIGTESSNTRSFMGVSENGERNVGFWEPSTEHDVEMNSITNTTRLETSVIAENDLEQGGDEWENNRTIRKTVNVSQVSS